MTKTTNDLLKELVAVPSYVGLDCNEAKLAEKIKTFFAGSRYKIEEQTVEGDRKNLYVHDGTSPKIIFVGHMDTVPPKEETENSFKPTEVGGKLYGLGSVDMKSGLAVAINAMLENKKPGLAGIFTVDEEYDCVGAVRFAEKYNLKPKLLINLEPTDLEILSGCRGIIEFTFEVYGKAAHAGMKYLGINAIEKTVEMVNILQVELTKIDPKNGAKSSVNLSFIHGGNLEGFDKDRNAKISDVGNIVPNYCRLQVEIRTANSKIKFDYVKKLLERMAKKLKVKVTNLKLNYELGSMSVLPSEINTFVEAVGRSGIPIKYRDINASGYYEVQVMREKWGCPVVVFGPGPNEMSHKANEYVDLETVEETEEVVSNYLKENL